MAVRHSGDNMPRVDEGTDPCSVCRNSLENSTNIVRTTCFHYFHKNCLIEWIQTSSTCPQCRQNCTRSSLTDITTESYRELPRPRASQGAIPRVLQSKRSTRSSKRNQNPLDWTLNVPNTDQAVGASMSVDGNNGHRQSDILPEHNNINMKLSTLENKLNSEFLSMHEILSGLTQQISQISIQRQSRSEPEWPRENFPPLNTSGLSFSARNENHSENDPPRFNRTQGFNPITPVNLQRQSTMSSVLNTSGRIAQLIQTWNISFNGNSSKLPVDKFIYMVTALTNDSLGGDFEVLCEHLHILFNGRGLDWYWRYRRSVERVEWTLLCEALRSHFQDHLSDGDIKELIREKKQKESESFDEFYSSIQYLCDRLRYPIPDHELLDILRRNLRPKIRSELFYQNITSVAQLRHLLLRREALLDDIDKPGFRSARRQINEVELDSTTYSVSHENEISELGKIKCWNCRKDGHRYVDCLEDRKVFCYGCGLEGILKPNCLVCQSRGNSKAGVQSANQLCPK